MLGVVLANARRLDGLVSDLLDVARLEPGRVRTETEPVDVVTLVQNVARAVEPLVSGKNQTLVVTPSVASVPLSPTRGDWSRSSPTWSPTPTSTAPPAPRSRSACRSTTPRSPSRCATPASG